MTSLIKKVPFLAELFLNGSFIFLFSLKSTDRIPSGWDVDLISSILNFSVWLVPIILSLVVVSNYLSSKDLVDFLRKHIFSLVVFIPLVLTWGDLEFAFMLSSAHLLSSILTLYDDSQEK